MIPIGVEKIVAFDPVNQVVDGGRFEGCGSAEGGTTTNGNREDQIIFLDDLCDVTDGFSFVAASTLRMGVESKVLGVSVSVLVVILIGASLGSATIASADHGKGDRFGPIGNGDGVNRAVDGAGSAIQGLLDSRFTGDVEVDGIGLSCTGKELGGRDEEYGGEPNPRKTGGGSKAEHHEENPLCPVKIP